MFDEINKLELRWSEQNEFTFRSLMSVVDYPVQVRVPFVTFRGC